MNHYAGIDVSLRCSTNRTSQSLLTESKEAFTNCPSPRYPGAQASCAHSGCDGQARHRTDDEDDNEVDKGGAADGHGDLTSFL
jgi:hypothetical protein